MATLPRSWTAVLAVGTAVALVAAACEADTVPPKAKASMTPHSQAVASARASGSGDPAVWYVAPQQNLQESSTAFTALVHRVACNSGVTGDVLKPEIRMTETEVVVTFTVAPKEREIAPCPGNDEVPYEVKLNEPLNGRSLVDGLCLSADRFLARSGYCTPSATRFPI
ncbi:hypothetical protein ACPCHT_25025 [Nucisporomicrobium flavum]|uniref:hypothetical protein n=1 Tax=Nucisporomicrobium flavum TaxID=2785915 RepID=UPI003C2CE8A9